MVCNVVFLIPSLSNYLSEYPLDSVGPTDIAKFFVDPTGTHLIVTTVGGDNYYCDTTLKKCKFSALQKWSFRISALEFLYNFSGKTGYEQLRSDSEPLIGYTLPSSPVWTVLIGTDRGVLYETTIDAKGKFSDVFTICCAFFIYILCV